MASVTIYHNPKCSKSRETLLLLETEHIVPEIILYLINPPTIDTLKSLIQQLGFKSARELMRTKEDLYQQLQLDNQDLTEADLLAALYAHPILIERPIVVANNQAKIGRPPESILTLLK